MSLVLPQCVELLNPGEDGGHWLSFIGGSNGQATMRAPQFNELPRSAGEEKDLQRLANKSKTIGKALRPVKMK